LSEKRSNNVYVPRDESFSELKQLSFSANTLQSAFHALLPVVKTAVVDKNLGFPLFSAIDDLFNEGFNLPPQAEKGFLASVLPRLVRLVNEARNDILRFETPATMDSKIFFYYILRLVYIR
jgi:lipoxygenase